MTKHISGLFLATCLMWQGLALAADPQAVRYYEDAVSRFNAGDAAGAVIQLKNALQVDPGQLSAKILLGRAYLALGQPRAAEEELLQARDLGADPLLVALPLARARNQLGEYEINIEQIIPTRFPRKQQPDLWVELGLARLLLKDAAGARIAYDEALSIDPGHTGARVGLARIPLEDRRFAEAARQAEAIIADTPEAAEAWFIRGSAAHATGRFDLAAESYGRAYELDPQHVAAAVGEATALLEAGKPATTVALLKPLREQFPNNPSVAYLQSEAYGAIGREAEANEARAAAAAIVNRFAPSDLANRSSDLLLYGTIAFESGQLETAYNFLSAYVETSGADAQGRKMLGKTLLAMGKPAEAQDVLLRLSTGNRADAEALALLGDAHIQLGDIDAAERYYRDALENHNGGPGLVRRLGMAQFTAGRRTEGLSTLEALAEQVQGTARADTSLLLGLLYYSEGRFNEAAGVAQRLIEGNPGHYTARNLLALVMLAQGDAESGRRMLREILAEAPEFRPARYNLVKLDIAAGDYAAAAGGLRAILAVDDKDTRALLEFARLARAQGDNRSAIDYLEKLRELEPRDLLGNVELINAYLAADQVAVALDRAKTLDRLLPAEFLVKDALARVHIAAGNVKDAAIVLKDVVRFAGEDAEQLIYAGRLQSQIGAYADAAWAFTKALSVAPGNDTARIDLATALYRQRKFADAAALVDEILAHKPQFLRALTLKADMQMARGEVGAAIETYRDAQQVSDSPLVVLSLHRALMTEGRGDEALQELLAWNARYPGVPTVMDLLADHLAFEGHTEDALELREQLTGLTPEDASAWVKLTRSLSNVDTERALKAALKAHELAPDNPAVLDSLGWTFTQLGELDRGLAYLREALARDAGSAVIRFHLGVALQEYGNLQAARRELEQALRLSGSFPQRAEAEARLEALRAQR